MYVYGILSHSTIGPTSTADVLFYIDDELNGTFAATPNGTPTYTYDVLLYAADSLTHAAHTLTLQNGQVGGSVSLVLLDYIVYSTYVSQSLGVCAC